MIKDKIPLAILFRALHCSSDKDILAKICLDNANDTELFEALRPSLEEAKIIDQ
jgi:DNA-directed RNA polymerase beta subunit